MKEEVGSYLSQFVSAEPNTRIAETAKKVKLSNGDDE